MDGFEICRFKKNLFFDDSAHSRYCTYADALDGFDTPMWITDERGIGGASICKNGGDVEFKYVKFGIQWDGACSVKHGVEYTTSAGSLFSDVLDVFSKVEFAPYFNALFGLFGSVYGVVVK